MPQLSSRARQFNSAYGGEKSERSGPRSQRVQRERSELKERRVQMGTRLRESGYVEGGRSRRDRSCRTIEDVEGGKDVEDARGGDQAGKDLT